MLAISLSRRMLNKLSESIPVYCKSKRNMKLKKNSKTKPKEGIKLK